MKVAEFRRRAGVILHNLGYVEDSLDFWVLCWYGQPKDAAIQSGYWINTRMQDTQARLFDRIASKHNIPQSRLKVLWKETAWKE